MSDKKQDTKSKDDENDKLSKLLLNFSSASTLRDRQLYPMLPNRMSETTLQERFSNEFIRLQQQQLQLNMASSLHKNYSQIHNHPSLATIALLDAQRRQNQQAYASAILNSQLSNEATLSSRTASPSEATSFAAMSISQHSRSNDQDRNLQFQNIFSTPSNIESSKLTTSSSKRTFSKLKSMEAASVNEKPFRDDICQSVSDCSRFSCKARGMPMDHNFKTAYFLISPNIKNGEDLICSYEECRKQGIKFQYCATCNLPVAKRNFKKRHNHSDIGKNIDANKARKSKIPRFNQRKDEDISNSSSDSDDREYESSQEQDTRESKFQTDQLKRWRKLFDERPKNDDAEALTSWLSSVLIASDNDSQGSKCGELMPATNVAVSNYTQKFVKNENNLENDSKPEKQKKSEKRGPKANRALSA